MEIIIVLDEKEVNEDYYKLIAPEYCINNKDYRILKNDHEIYESERYADVFNEFENIK